MVNPQSVIIDSNMVDNFSEMNIDPVSAFENSGYTLYITKDVKREIEALISAVDKRLEYSDDEQKLRDCKKKELAIKILKYAQVRSFFGFSDNKNSGSPQRFGGFGIGVLASDEDVRIYNETASKESKVRPTGIPVNRTDNDLVMLARRSWVLTANYKESHWEKAQDLPFLLQWFTLREKLLANGRDLVAAIDEIYKERME